LIPRANVKMREQRPRGRIGPVKIVDGECYGSGLSETFEQRTERVEIAREAFSGNANVEVDTFDGLLVDYARKRRAGVIVKGLRAVSDFEFEMQMALMNRKLNPEVETVFMMPTEPYTYVSSRLVKEVVALGGSVHGLVPESVEKRLRDKKLARETLRA